MELLAKSYDSVVATPNSVVIDDQSQLPNDQALNKMFGTVQIDEKRVG